jgi:RNA polymerase sigma-70 factor (ECF subfamily)
MRRVASGDQRALRLLMDRHMKATIRLAERTLGHTADADEVAQEAFIRVWRHADRYDGGRAQFTTWLYRIVLNLCLDRRRRRTTLPIELVLDVASKEPAADDLIIGNERRRLAEEALANLPVRQRAAIALFYAEGLSGREGAAALEVSEKSFESLLSRARSACRAYVAALTRGGSKDGRD